jgi:hypothetical protein
VKDDCIKTKGVARLESISNTVNVTLHETVLKILCNKTDLFAIVKVDTACATAFTA